MNDTVTEQPIRSGCSLAARAATIVRDFSDVACDHLELAVLEAQQAGVSLAKMLCAAIIISVLFVSAWLTLIAAGIVWATTEGISWISALGIAAAINLGAAGLLFAWIRSQTGELLFAATLRQLRRDSDLVEERS
jgi:uncharacterized membrane protein YqjE